ncbi:MAG: hypothetical protein LBU86_04870 [Oscillospiraceae bacterium]|jgi:hypothetical protein|nr:hypothetical protein [Oscillospiraceae bacterium]
MMTQIKYSLRNNFSRRLTGILITLVVNLGFFLAWQMGARHPAVQIVGVVLSGLSLVALIVVSVISDVATVRDIFRAPNGYSLMLAPVPGWKLLAGRVISIVLCDTVSYVAAITGVVIQGLLLAGARNIFPRMVPYAGFAAVVFAAGYLLLILAIFFSEALRASVFHTMRGKGWLSVAATCLLLYAMSFANLLLIPFAATQRFGLFVSIWLPVGFSAGTAVSVAITLAQAAVLFILTAKCIERKINL